jgi:hypothetical protein
VAGGASDAVGVAGAVQADAFLVQRDPDDSHRIVRAGRQEVKFVTALALFQQRLVMTIVRQLGDAAYFSITDR